MRDEAIILRIIEKAGGVRSLARKIGVAAPSIVGWRLRGQVPSSRIGQVEEATGIPRHELRPDLYRAGE